MLMVAYGIRTSCCGLYGRAVEFQDGRRRVHLRAYNAIPTLNERLRLTFYNLGNIDDPLMSSQLQRGVYKVIWDLDDAE